MSEEPEVTFSRKRMPRGKKHMRRPDTLPDGSKRVKAAGGSAARKHPDWTPKPHLAEKPESIEERGAVTYNILRAYHPDLTIYEVAKRAGMLSSMDDVRRTLAYHKKKCKTMRQRIDDLNKQLEGKLATKIIL